MRPILLYLIITIILTSCKQEETEVLNIELSFDENILDYKFTPKDSLDRSGLMFSDQGAWFAYSLSDSTATLSGFSGPFLMTQQNGVWCSDKLLNFKLKGENNSTIINWKTSLHSGTSFASHLEQSYKTDSLAIDQTLLFLSGNTVLQKTSIRNTSEIPLTLYPAFDGKLFDVGLSAEIENNLVKISSAKSTAVGYIQFIDEPTAMMAHEEYYNAYLDVIFLKPNESREYTVSQSFIFPEYSWEAEQQLIAGSNFDSILKNRIAEKESQLKSLITKRKSQFSEDRYSEVLAKAQLTLQNNWRQPAGEIKHSGLFPSYHYKWFNGFWAWDSWKHAVGLSHYDTELAKEQIRLMFTFQSEDGFVADCVFRDTLIEQHNYRDTKPPLSAWAVAKVYEIDDDLEFVKEMYPKLKKYHDWWYTKRDHDQDGICEYGSTDGTLVAAKWESGMDNAIRFDNSKILKNTEGAYSLDQESVDLNAYLYAEKLYLAALADALLNYEESVALMNEADILKEKIQTQFYDPNDGWFYDTDLDGSKFIKGEGSEGWTALWAQAATQEQAEAVKNKMMDPKKFFTKVPFQTMSADHEKFDPLKGYWRGPNWLDQAYFGIKGLRLYGFETEANLATVKIIEGAEGLLKKGMPIRENYHPLSGEGLHAHNFSWSAAHLIMLLVDE